MSTFSFSRDSVRHKSDKTITMLIKCFIKARVVYIWLIYILFINEQNKQHTQ